MIFRRARFAQVIEAQLELFARDHRDVIDEARDRLAAYDRAGRDEAEELYGDYVDAVETGTEILADLRDHYARTVDDPDRYCVEFNRTVAKRLPAFALEIENR
jgi:isocitrate dehydrogenase kinase/phosphatase